MTLATSDAICPEVSVFALGFHVGVSDECEWVWHKGYQWHPVWSHLTLSWFLEIVHVYYQTIKAGLRFTFCDILDDLPFLRFEWVNNWVEIRSGDIPIHKDSNALTRGFWCIKGFDVMNIHFYERIRRKKLRFVVEKINRFDDYVAVGCFSEKMNLHGYLHLDRVRMLRKALFYGLSFNWMDLFNSADSFKCALTLNFWWSLKYSIVYTW
jgi:hypothetical protein